MSTSLFSYKALQDKVQQSLKALELNKQPAELYEPLSYVLEVGGKRLRPVISLMACDLFEGLIDEALEPAVGLELFHNFTLVHDDIMDQARMRRGQLTVHELWSSDNAILSGDLMQVLANRKMAMVKDDILRQTLQLYNETAIQVCEGQQLDMNFEKRDDIALTDYLHMIRLKTATLLGASLKLGAITGRASGDDQENSYHLGLNLGTAFQIQDDLLDTFGETEQFGKTIGGDIVAGKKTYLILKALEMGDDDQSRQLKTLLEDEEKPAGDKISEVKAILHSLDVAEYARAERDRYYDKARSSLQAINAPEERKEPLFELAQYLLERQV